jgi:pyoverdine/dityrosine biosynthesis protein Dit1
MPGNNVDWGVRTEYAMVNESVNRENPREFKLDYSIYADNAQEAWELAMKAFPMKMIIDGKVYSRISMRVEID